MAQVHKSKRVEYERVVKWEPRDVTTFDITGLTSDELAYIAASVGVSNSYAPGLGLHADDAYVVLYDGITTAGLSSKVQRAMEALRRWNEDRFARR